MIFVLTKFQINTSKHFRENSKKLYLRYHYWRFPYRKFASMLVIPVCLFVTGDFLTGNSPVCWSSRFVCLSVCLFVDMLLTLFLREFSTYQHQINRVGWTYTSLQIYKIWEVKVKGQGHRGQISNFRLVNDNSKSFRPIFIIFSIWVNKVILQKPIDGWPWKVKGQGHSLGQSSKICEKLSFSTFFELESPNFTGIS